MYLTMSHWTYIPLPVRTCTLVTISRGNGRRSAAGEVAFFERETPLAGNAFEAELEQVASAGVVRSAREVRTVEADRDTALVRSVGIDGHCEVAAVGEAEQVAVGAHLRRVLGEDAAGL